MKIYEFKGNKNIIGPVIKKLRTQNKMSLATVSKQMELRGVITSPTTISRIENNLRFAADYEVLVLADIFKVSVDALYPKDILN